MKRTVFYRIIVLKAFAPFFILFSSIILFADKAEAYPKDRSKQRVLILTDIGNEPDDTESLIRFLLYSNQWEVEGIIATTSCWLRDKTEAWRIKGIIKAYSKVRPNLLLHEPGYPSGKYLQKRIKNGYPGFGMAAVGKGFDSEGSEFIIKIIQKEDDRPIWIAIWGGSNCLAQALWKLNNTLQKPEMDKIIRKIRVYAISDQDNSGPWLRNTFKSLFYIVSPGYQEDGADGYYYATWSGISGEQHFHFPSGANKYIVSNEWINENIQFNHGPLGELYPDIACIMEGDSPSFLYLVNNGLNSPENPNWGSWGGRYELYKPPTQLFFHEPETRPIWTTAKDWVKVDNIIYIDEKATIWRWRNHYQNDFAARMDWCISSFAEANHPPVAKLNHPNEITVVSKGLFVLDASASSDPDGDDLSYEWVYYREAGNFPSKINLNGNKGSTFPFTAPVVTNPKKLHFIVVVTDNGSPSLTRYQRVIIDVIPKN